MTVPPIEQADEALPGQDRPPSRWPVRLGAVAVAAVVVVGAVVGVRNLTADDDHPMTAPTTPATRPTPSASILSPSLTVPAAARLAITTAFPGARTAVISAIVVRNVLVSRHYGARTATSTVTIEIDSDEPVTEAVLRTATSVQLVQQILGDRVSVTVTARRGSTTRTDFVAAQQLIRDPRLLAQP